MRKEKKHSLSTGIGRGGSKNNEGIVALETKGSTEQQRQRVKGRERSHNGNANTEHYKKKTNEKVFEH